ncbi:three-helix bundle dimerization domain-containing protein [Actinokineospora sp. HUAS TT18]|uniref:three-helix bundle dimerization domain-containing protein n=1 Tax=Actinokineospora sp. HUAS TT18 TaxID=3447451 RepID=UPI003F51D06A
MTTQREIGGVVVEHELASVVRRLVERFPHRSEAEIRDVVMAVYHRISAGATVRAHLLPLTLNRSTAELMKKAGDD